MDTGPRLVRLSLLYAALFGAVAILYPFFPIYLTRRGFSPSKIGLILGLMEVAVLAGPFTLSRLADRTGRFRSVMIVMTVLAAGALLLTDRTRTFPAVLLTSTVYAFFFKNILAMADAYSGRVLVDSSRNYGRVRVWGSYSFIVVSLVLQFSGILDSATSGTLMLGFLIALAALVSVYLVIPGVSGADIDSSGKRTGLRGMPSGYFSFLAVSFIGNIGFAVFKSFGSIYFSEFFSLSAVGGLFALSAVTEIPTMLHGGRILRFLGHRKMLFIALAAALVRLGMLAAFPHAVPIILSQLTHTFVFGFFIITGVDWVNRIVPDGNRALGMGLFMAMSNNAAILVGSAVGGYLLEFGGFPLLFGLAAVFPLIGMIWIALDRRIGGSAYLDAENTQEALDE